MSVENNTAIARQHMDHLDQRDLEGAAQVCGSKAKWHGFGPEPLDREGWKATITMFLNGFPDTHFLIDEVIAEGDSVAVRHSFRGTHQAEFQGIPPTSKQVTVPAIVIFRVANGKIIEAWLNADFMGLMQQLGVVSEPDTAGI